MKSSLKGKEQQVSLQAVFDLRIIYKERFKLLVGESESAPHLDTDE